MKHWPFKVE
jgi:heat shock 70kDa protein 1/2/6/8